MGEFVSILQIETPWKFCTCRLQARRARSDAPYQDWFAFRPFNGMANVSFQVKKIHDHCGSFFVSG